MAGLASIDERVVKQLLVDRMQSQIGTSTGRTTLEGETAPRGLSMPVYRLEGFTLSRRGRPSASTASHGDAPDMADVSITIGVTLPDTATDADLGELETALSRVAAALVPVSLEDSATSHTVQIIASSCATDASPGDEEPAAARSGSVTVTALAYRIAGNTLS